MKIIDNHTFFRNWCGSMKTHLIVSEYNLSAKNDEDYFKSLVAHVEKAFETLHETLEVIGGVQVAAEGVLLSWQELQLVIEQYGDDEILTPDKIGEYVLYELSMNIVEEMVTRRERILNDRVS